MSSSLGRIVPQEKPIVSGEGTVRELLQLPRGEVHLSGDFAQKSFGNLTPGAMGHHSDQSADSLYLCIVLDVISSSIFVCLGLGQ